MPVTVTVGVTDLAAALPFWDAALGALGFDRVVEYGDEEDPAEDASQAADWLDAAGWGRRHGAADGRPLLWLVRAAVPTSGLHLRLAAASMLQVETFFAATVAAGGRPRATPRPWTLYRRGEFGAMVADANDNVIEAVMQEAGPTPASG